MKTTDLKSIKSIVLSFLYFDIEETEFSPIVVTHPIFESGIVMLPNSNKPYNILEDEDAYNEIIECYKNRIDKANSIDTLFYMIRKSYKLTFIKFIETYLSIEDLSTLLAEAWTSSENPNQDVNVSLAQLTRMFKKTNKKYLMTDEEYEIYNNLPETFTVYRGVASGRNAKGMSWTQNLEVAEWFANRFNYGNKGYIQRATANKKDVLAYFNRRDEDEIVINVKNLNDICIL